MVTPDPTPKPRITGEDIAIPGEEVVAVSTAAGTTEYTELGTAETISELRKLVKREHGSEAEYRIESRPKESS